eukprot:1310689-Prymnesium_polylepis.1
MLPEMDGQAEEGWARPGSAEGERDEVAELEAEVACGVSGCGVGGGARDGVADVGQQVDAAMADVVAPESGAKTGGVGAAGTPPSPGHRVANASCESAAAAAHSPPAAEPSPSFTPAELVFARGVPDRAAAAPPPLADSTRHPTGGAAGPSTSPPPLPPPPPPPPPRPPPRPSL